MGLSERRSQWLCDWTKSVEDRKEVSDIEFAAGILPRWHCRGRDLFWALYTRGLRCLGDKGLPESPLGGPGGFALDLKD